MKLTIKTFAWAAVFAASLPAAASADTLLVPTDYPSIQSAIDAAAEGDTVRVLPGHYAENIDFKGKGIAVIGQKGYRKTFIEASNSGPVVLMESGEPATAELSGFTLKGGSGFYGGGVSLASTSPTIRRNRFIGNAGSFASGIGGNNASPTIDGNVFEQQQCGPNDFLSGVMVFINGSSPRIVNNIVRGNNCNAIDMTLPEGNTPLVANNTLVGNDTGIVVDARVHTGLQVYQNNIITGGRRGLHVLFLSAGQEPTFKNNDVVGNDTNYSGIADMTGIDGNISAEPRFLKAGKGNYRLKTDSPCIDTGATFPGGNSGKDVYGDKRYVDGNGDHVKALDIGAAEFQPD